ncbi:hypothetical protein GHT06_006524 [Daphnia sinensis]|uniref:Uncharacterized protein n=1 Tax=Daphnia sinensis TaxID=1820382 RepID=A0AAD5KVW7_9CRUS|nr:hypothetical protein GHT06_006524 [Daphnia sinensis]
MIAWGLLKNGQHPNEKFVTHHGLDKPLTLEDCDTDWTKCQEELKEYITSNDPLVKTQQTQLCLFSKSVPTQNWATLTSVRQKVSYIKTTRPTTTTTRATTTTRPTTTTTRATTMTTKATTTTRPTSTTTSKPIITPKFETPKTTTTSTTTTTIRTTTTAATTIQSTSKTSEEIIQINQNPTE